MEYYLLRIYLIERGLEVKLNIDEDRILPQSVLPVLCVMDALA
jgi:hypothetical protein